MHILYVNPAKLQSGLDSIFQSPPLNLMALAGVVPEHDATLFDFKFDKYDEMRFRAELNRADVVAITSLTPQIYDAFDVARLAKEQGCVTILGGYHSTLDPEFVARNPNVDVVVRGEGEHTFKELVDYLDGNPRRVMLKDIDGLLFKDETGTVVQTKPRQLECNMDAFFFPRRDLIRKKDYLFFGARADVVETSRGCPHRCSFCCITKMWKDPENHVTYRTKSLDRIIKEIEHVDKRKEFIFFADDNFTINTTRVKAILEAMIASKRASKLHYGCQSRVDTLFDNPWLMDLMAKARFRQVFLGIESLHQQSLDSMNKKHVTPEKAIAVVKALKARGISVYCGMIIGYPGETRQMVYQNIQYAKYLNPAMIQFTPITAFPGTAFFDEMKENGMITSFDYRNYDLFNSMMRTEQLTGEEIQELVKEAYAAYFYSKEYALLLVRQFLNPFSKFRWLFRKIPKVINQFLVQGGKMLRSQGITRDIVSEELKNTVIPDLVATPSTKEKITWDAKSEIPDISTTIHP